jgi:pyridoxal phosphate enzyme (YggS family)
MNIETHYCQVAHTVREKALACGRRPEEITLIAVSKTFPFESIQSVYQEGGRDFGESRIQEALEKISQMPKDCKWHLIGTLQSNKVNKAISAFQLIHSVDTPLLAQKISEASQAKGIMTSILLQVNTSGEKTKHGLSPEEWERALERINQLSHLRIEGLMTMAPYTEDEQVIRACFHHLYQLRESWRKQMKNPAIFQHLSMGMSHDYLIAIEEGATLVRVGSAIFGARVILP